jgi:hypothetical protein
MGGSTYAGKSTLTDLICSKYGITPYHGDDHVGLERIEPQKHLTYHPVSRLSWNELWMRPVDIQVSTGIEVLREWFGMMMEDLLQTDGSISILAESAALLPDLVADVSGESTKAIWLISSEKFLRSRYPQRTELLNYALSGCKNPETAFDNWMSRDAAISMSMVQERSKTPPKR